jgi:outer membrane protein OmpA-like peptidoglycan-associated protein
MKVVQIGPALAALLVAACAPNSRQATAPQRAAQHAEEEKQEAQQEAQGVRRDAERARQEAQEATRAQREADQNAQWASQRAAQAEAQAGQPLPALREGTTERQADNASSARLADPSVLFAANNADLSSDAKVKLDEVAKGLRNNAQGYNVILEGYSDDNGAASYNVQLSRRRAHAVANYLESKGIRSERIFTQSMSPNLASKEETNRERALNRRVEIVTQPAGK